MNEKDRSQKVLILIVVFVAMIYTLGIIYAYNSAHAQ